MVTRQQFAELLLVALNIPIRQPAIDALVAWMGEENTQALNNPLATERTTDDPGETRFNSVGVKNYGSLALGISATVQTLLNGLYTNILTELESGTFESIAQAIDSSPWGDTNVVNITPDFNAEVNSSETLKNPLSYVSVAPTTASGTGAVVSPPVPVPAPPVLGTTYVIQPGDTLTAIAAKFGVSESEVFAKNAQILDSTARRLGFPNSINGNLIFPGTKIFV